MPDFNALEHLKRISDEQIQYVIDSLNTHHKITDSEEPFITEYMILKNWGSECTSHLISRGYKGEHLLVERDWKNEGDPTAYALYNPDEIAFSNPDQDE
ncbi:hypothetical protein [Psychrobacter sanguinis]|uniref:hypothetical protein n=1 Tax=Psychrobacter sanguinis TaxID=861445 RepID=UPI0028AAC9A2|nr:hypothetical protein [Psychrobacter sanguinis]